MMEKEERYEQFYIEADQQGTRIDLVLSLLLPDISRSFIQKLFERGSVKVDGVECRSKKYKVQTGELVEINLPEPEILSVEPEDIPIDIVYEDDDVLVVNKPRGMVVHPAAGNYSGTLVNAVMFHCGDRLSSINGVIRPGIVHRIDKDTSGLLMIAKNDAAHESLSNQLAVHSVTRRYQALVYDNIKADEGTVDAPIGRDVRNRLRQAVTDGQHGKHAVTHYRVLERFGRHTLIEARLETGRTHQIRVHMAYIHHPLVGDPIYGPRRDGRADGQMLHAKVLGFVHPRTGEYMEFDSSLPAYFQEQLEKLRSRGLNAGEGAKNE